MFVKHASVISSPQKARRIHDNRHGTREDTNSGSEKLVMVPQDNPWETQEYTIGEGTALNWLFYSASFVPSTGGLSSFYQT